MFSKHQVHVHFFTPKYYLMQHLQCARETRFHYQWTLIVHQQRQDLYRVRKKRAYNIATLQLEKEPMGSDRYQFPLVMGQGDVQKWQSHQPPSSAMPGSSHLEQIMTAIDGTSRAYWTLPEASVQPEIFIKPDGSPPNRAIKRARTGSVAGTTKSVCIRLQNRSLYCWRGTTTMRNLGMFRPFLIFQNQLTCLLVRVREQSRQEDTTLPPSCTSVLNRR